jgi:hypothetical protein
MCMAGISPQRTADIAARRATRRWGANRRELLTLLAAGLVESNLSQDYGPGEGDRDSVGFLQQRPSMGWGGYIPGKRGIRTDTDDFMRALRKTNTRGLSVGEAAQAVQRSAFPDRYQTRLPEARRLLRGAGGRSAPSPGRSGGGGGSTPDRLIPGVEGAQGMPQGSDGITALLEALGSKPQPRSSAGLQAPAFSAQAVMPAGAQIPSGGGGAAPAPGVEELIAAIATEGGDVQNAPGNEGGTIPGKRFGGVPEAGGLPVGGKLRGGRVVVDPNADRAGARTRGSVVKFVQQVSAIAGTPVRIGTGTRHSRLTVSGNVSDHWGGNAADIPASGRRLVRLGQAALIAAGMPEREARKQTGGLYNVNGAQIIFATDEGGNHHDHLHVRPPRRRRG